MTHCSLIYSQNAFRRRGAKSRCKWLRCASFASGPEDSGKGAARGLVRTAQEYTFSCENQVLLVQRHSGAERGPPIAPSPNVACACRSRPVAPQWVSTSIVRPSFNTNAETSRALAKECSLMRALLLPTL